MSYHGPKLDPVPGAVTVWNWLFDGQTSVEQQPAPLLRRHGFRDAATGSHTSFQSIKEQATQCATALTSIYGLKARETVAVLAQNSVRYAITVFAAGRVGATVTALPSTAMAQDIAHYLSASSARIVFYDKTTAGEVAAAAAFKGPAQEPYTLISLDGAGETGGKSMPSLQQLVAEGCSLQEKAPAAAAWTFPQGKTNKDVCAFLVFSSGTTGKPKAIKISHANMIAQCMQMRALISGQPGVLLGILPFFHITGLVHLLHLPVLLDQDIVIMGQFTLSSMLHTVVKYRCEELWLVPPLLIRMVSDDVVNKYDTSFVRQFNTGAAPLSPKIIEKLAIAYPKVALRQAWGMTESCSCLTVTPPGLATYTHAAKVGKVLAGTEIKIVSAETGKQLSLGEEGELWARGPQVTMGYLDNEDETRRVYDADGFLHTGDLGTVHPDGFVTIHDRIKEMIKVRGHGVAPAELEDTLLGHPHVVDAAVIGVPHDYSGEVPRAYVVLAAGIPSSDKTRCGLELHVERYKARYMRLAGGVEFVEAIPKNTAGKVLRKVLKEDYKKRSEKEAAAKL